MMGKMRKGLAVFLVCVMVLTLVPMSAAGATVVASGTVGEGGAPWRLYSDGTLRVSAGTIEWWDDWGSPWYAYRDDILNIVFAGPIIGGASLQGLFSLLENVTEIKGLEHFDTQNVTNMSNMFTWASSLTSLDLSSWNIRRVTDMGGMFAYANSLVSLDLSNWDTRNVMEARGMFLGTDSLRQLALGSDFGFGWGFPWLSAPANETYTGRWQNVGTGTPTNPQGMFIFTNEQLLSNIHGPTITDTWVWQPRGSGGISVIIAGTVGEGGAPWRLYDDGTLVVDEGFIEWEWVGETWPARSPWDFHFQNIYRIIFTGPMVGGASLQYLFTGLLNVVTIEGLEYFDTSNVKDMRGMFGQTRRLTSLDLSNFDTSSVTDMRGMFSNAGLTSLDLSGFDTSNVTNMSWMFETAERLTNLNLSGWDTSDVTDMSYMFSRASQLTTLDLSGFDVSNVTNMESIFLHTHSLTNLNLPGWNTRNVTNMSSMFASTRALTSLDLSDWDTSNVTNMRGMFADTSELINLNLSSWDTRNVTDMGGMFVQAGSLANLDLSNFDTSNVTMMDSMFAWTPSLENLDLSGFDTSSVTNMSRMFAGASSLECLDLSGFDTSNVTNMSQMFSYASSLISLDLSSWDTRNVTEMWWMFEGASSLRQLTLKENFVFRGNIALPPVPQNDTYTGRWQNVGTGTPANPQGEFVFTSAQLMDNFNGATMADTWVWQPRIATGNPPYGTIGEDGAPWRLYDNGTLVVDAGTIDWNDYHSPWDAFRNSIYRIEFTGPIIGGASLRSLFANLENVVSIEGLGYFDTSNVTNMRRMFYNANSLTSLDLSNFNTHNVAGWLLSGAFVDSYMSAMFYGTSSLRQLTLGEDFRFGVQIDSSVTGGQATRLPPVPQNDTYTGYWQNVGTGTPANPQGEFVFTSAQLMDNFRGATMADTWVWQPWIVAPPVHSITLSAPESHTFPAATVGYGPQAPLTVTVTNTGNVATGVLTVTLSHTAYFSLSAVAGELSLGTETIPSIAAGETATFTMRPNTGLAIGTYASAITVDGADVAAQSFTVYFRVYPDGTTLQTILTAATQRVQHNYTPETWVRLAIAKIVAQDVLQNEDATGPQIAQAINSLELAKSMLTLAPLPFTDVAGHWALQNGSIEFVWRQGIMVGTSATIFEPETNFNREQAVGILFRMYHGRSANASDPRTTPFTDVSAGAWYAPYINWAFRQSLVTGTNPTTFGTGDSITRQDFATLMHRFANFMEIDTSVPGGFTPPFPDAYTIGPWAEDAMTWAVYTRLFTGTDQNLLLPWGTANRAEAATILMRYIQALGE